MGERVNIIMFIITRFGGHNDQSARARGVLRCSGMYNLLCVLDSLPAVVHRFNDREKAGEWGKCNCSLSLSLPGCLPAEVVVVNNLAISK